MIGKPQWFRRRKYTGWGFTPATWQGWVYVAVLCFPFILISFFHSSNQAILIFTIGWAGIFCVDFVDIVIHLSKDERDRIHEAIAERNALWIVITVLVVGIGYQSAVSVISGVIKVDPVIIIAIVAGIVVKLISNIYLDRKD